MSKIGDIVQSGGDVASAIRGGDVIGALGGAAMVYSQVNAMLNENPADWRAQLSIPSIPSFRGSPVLKPLLSAGGMIFPYTPQIQTSYSANYQPISNVVHVNNPFYVYRNSNIGEIVVTAPMNVEDVAQGTYWIASLHYFRSMLKMFTGKDLLAGCPPPIAMFNAYGGHMFKNVPVVVKSFSITLENDCDYIPVPVTGSMMGEISDITDTVSDVMSELPSFGGVSELVSSVASTAGAIADGIASLGFAMASKGGNARVPTKSSFNISLQPIYSRKETKNFSLDKFVSGGYLKSDVGRI